MKFGSFFHLFFVYFCSRSNRVLLSLVADINECDSDPCQNDSTCTDLVGKYRCDCVSGITGAQCETGRSSLQHFESVY